MLQVAGWPVLAAHRDRVCQLAVFDRVWDTLARLYYGAGPAAEAWRGLRAKYRPLGGRAGSDADLERVLDRMVAEQPLIKPAVTSSGVVVVSGHRLASEAGRRALEFGGNVVDAAIAVSFALGVVEPEASGIGGDGMALVHLRGMEQPVVVDYKDQAPSHATLDNAVSSSQGSIVLKIRSTNRVSPGTVFIPMHYAEAAVNLLTSDTHIDSFSKTPGFKITAVRVGPVREGE